MTEHGDDGDKAKKFFTRKKSGVEAGYLFIMESSRNFTSKKKAFEGFVCF